MSTTATPAEPAHPTAVDEPGPRLDPALEIPPAQSAVVTRREAPTSHAPSKALALLKPIAPIAEIIEQQNELRAFIKAALVEDRDYGTIPGIEKPTLLKPGAERINNAYGVIPKFTILEQEADHDRVIEWRKQRRRYENGTWTGAVDTEEGKSFGLYRVVMLCQLVHRETGIIVAECIGSCSTLESKYIDRPRDCENTVIKMGEKRAFVGATLLGYGLSDEFTQDVEDTGTSDTGDERVDATNGGPGKVTAPICPVHNVAMKDFRTKKKNPRAPDWKCTQHTMQNGAKIWCDEKKWPGEWPPKSAAGNPQTPAEKSTTGPSSAGSGTESSAESSNANASNSSEPTTGTNSASTTSTDSSPATATSGSESSSATDGTKTATGEPVTRNTRIDWATDKRLAVIQGRRLADLKWEQLDYFTRNAHLLPAGWLEAVRKEIALREETGDVRDEPGADVSGGGYL